MQHYTYLHRKATTGEIFYVGKGTRPDRMKMRSGRSQRWTRIANKHGFVPEVIARWKTAEEAFAHERFLIKCFRDIGENLCNHTDGGEGAPGYKQSEQTKEKRNAKLRGQAKTSATIQRMRNAHAGKVIGQDTRQKIATTLLGRYAGGLNPNAKPVVCIETNEHFACMQDAATWLQQQGHAKASFKSIHAAVSGAKKTAYGYTWGRA